MKRMKRLLRPPLCLVAALCLLSGCGAPPPDRASGASEPESNVCSIEEHVFSTQEEFLAYLRDDPAAAPIREAAGGRYYQPSALPDGYTLRLVRHSFSYVSWYYRHPDADYTGADADLREVSFTWNYDSDGEALLENTAERMEGAWEDGYFTVGGPDEPRMVYWVTDGVLFQMNLPAVDFDPAALALTATPQQA